MSKKLRLLLDECVQTALARITEECSSGISKLENITAKHPLGNNSTTDEDVVNYARKHGLIVVTVEGDISERKFKICTHPGIIILAASHDAEKANLFKKLMKSGLRGECDHAVTKLRPNNPVILKRINGQVVQMPIDLHVKGKKKRGQIPLADKCKW